jgi:alpha-galactosidase
VKSEAVEYKDFPTVEWTLNFKNTGTQNTPILSEIHSVDVSMEPEILSKQIDHPWQQKNQGQHREISGRGGSYILHHSTGSPYRPDDFKPHETKIVHGVSKTIATNGGRPTDEAMPYFNVQREYGGGLIVVIGWAGQWSANFMNDQEKGMRMVGGQELTHFTLYPNEEVRAPRTVLQFWAGNSYTDNSYTDKGYIRSQNIWRQWMLAYNTPHPNGKLVQPHFAACSSHQYAEMVNATDQTQIEMIDRYLAEGIKLDYWWMDAGWYIMPHSKGWTETGTWEVDPKRFPKGLRAVSDHAHAKKVNIIVWFEPERVHAGTWLTETHPEWVLGGKNGGLLNLGNPETWNWLVNHIDNIITKEGIDFYRQDFNIDPLNYWRANDTENRQGITEIKHVTGYLAYWDELLRRHPGMLIDTCASGGRRLDIETLKRSVSLLRSDYIFEPTGNQGHTYGLSLWLPIFGTGALQSSRSTIYGGKSDISEPYKARSLLCPFENSCSDMRTPANPNKNESGSADYPNVRRYFEEWKLISPYFYGDFYPLTPYNIDNSLWIAWQYDLPKESKGVIQVFRRPESIYDAMRIKLQGLNPNATYHVKDRDNRINIRKNGLELMEHGLSVSFDTDYGAAIVFYEISQ